ncbi:hypothetical protein [Flavivirga spongiicola]|uniref:Uncharacterized protein n=1 Tax=Flavivirga spongiicola TaxID=421621 RepID=A0ABU7XWL6_9FLAO|nr:hypothetical protein [Flavivirga sp. MEBiC05379]MDO5979249.1 hypothetical protein [Flavivirga sp. MEBiC05379]
MDLKTERKIKFWLTTISKILVISLVLFKLVDILFEKKDTAPSEKEVLTTNLKEKQAIDSFHKKEPIVKEQKSSTIQTPNKKTEEQKNVAIKRATSPIYAKLHLVDNSFIWLKDKHKFVLKLANTTAALAENVTVNAVLIYEKEQQAILVQHKASIDAHGMLNIDFVTSNLLHTTLPKTIMLCINHESKNAKQKNWYKYLLGNKINGSGAIETRSVYYKTLSVSDGVYTNTAPNCIVQTHTSSTTNTKKDSDIDLENIKSSTQLFLRGLNNRSQITVKNTTTTKLYTQLSSVDSNKYSYGFSNKIEVVSHTKNTAIVRLVLTEKGRATYIKQQTAYDAENSPKKVSDFFKFLRRKGSSWEGRLINQNGIWKFDMY